tara:strand:+ start:1280 stop:1519 length:240 start_codon:yes stop_codon:yes gene_type:complete
MLLALLLTLPSCFTMTVWGFNVEQDADEQESAMVYDEDTEWSWKLFGLRVLVTPVALVLDCATAPLQVFFLGKNDDDDC